MHSDTIYKEGDIFKRTIGFELEIPDVERSLITLPSGYSWSKDEQITNTDGIRYSPNAKFGGEINTRPLKMCQQDRRELKELLASCYNNGGKIAWGFGYDMHIYAGDCSLEQIKNLWILGYYTDTFIRKACDLGEWFQYHTMLPTPTLEYLEKIRRVSSFEELRDTLANSSNKGFIRHPINVTSFFKHKTVEFRIFNTTYDFAEVEASVLFTFRFFNYGITHTEEDFKEIKTYEDFCRILKIRYKMASKICPLIFAGDQEKEGIRMTAVPLQYSASIIKTILKNTEGTLCCVNPNLYALELSLYKHREIIIYNQNEMNDVMYHLANKHFVLHWHGDFEFIEKYNDETPEAQLALLMLVHKIKKFVGSDLDYKVNRLEAIKAKLPETIEKAKMSMAKLVDMLTKVRYVFGNLNMAIRDEDNVFFQYEYNSKLNSTISTLKKCSDYSSQFTRIPTDYYDFVEKIPQGKKFYLISENQYLSNLNKLSKVGRAYLYGNEGIGDKKMQSKVVSMSIGAMEYPPDDLVIDDPAKLNICKVTPTLFSSIQRVFVKKVSKFTLPMLAYVIQYDKYCIGAFGFNWAKKEGFDLWLLSDFSTNNKIPRLAKLVLLCILSTEVKKSVSRWKSEMVKSLYTKVYTSHPVSMKYRGIFSKDKENCEPGRLFYTAEFGSAGNKEEIINKYKKYCGNDK